MFPGTRSQCEQSGGQAGEVGKGGALREGRDEEALGQPPGKDKPRGRALHQE